METIRFTPQAPATPALWPQNDSSRPVKRRIPRSVDEPKSIGYYLEGLRGIASRPDREAVLREFFSKHSINSPFHSKNVILLL